MSAFFTAPMSTLVNMNSMINQALVSSERLFDIIDMQDEVEDEKGVSSHGLSGVLHG